LNTWKIKGGTGRDGPGAGHSSPAACERVQPERRHKKWNVPATQPQGAVAFPSGESGSLAKAGLEGAKRAHEIAGEFQRRTQDEKVAVGQLRSDATSQSANLTVDLEVAMERFVGVEDARGSLGRLVEEVAAGGDIVALTKRGKALAVLVSRDEYLQMKLAASDRTRAELGEALGSVRRAVREAGLDVGVINEAIVAARQL